MLIDVRFAALAAAFPRAAEEAVRVGGTEVVGNPAEGFQVVARWNTHREVGGFWWTVTPRGDLHPQGGWRKWRAPGSKGGWEGEGLLWWEAPTPSGGDLHGQRRYFRYLLQRGKG